ncbi:SDR family oxidoreductase [Pontibacter sp. BT310]|uniref:dTDP-4-dehydrorhamnose reductase n=1 Tax=Pontibacter populi TaxID=890055 RepID=A0ABS6XA34_9BACT|nr:MULTISPECIES: SDR family oxidoreductase [Pontibacter]MBJ6117113.1 SDR family oxidoreductase [Pontibacter sp. BT310]MBR0569537.1 SDR family oxidoreductase [Microvirga sp. STS03]MBW3363966.1 SDR family oxidoreductase [Pontibacter populi]
MKRILITGSNGLLGQKLAELLLNQPDVEVLATSRGENKLATIVPALPFASMDVTVKAQVEEVISQFRPTHIIHTAAMTNVDQCETDHEGALLLNRDAVQFLVDACEKYNVHLIHVSTDFIFDGEDGPYSEDAKANPVNFYGETKRLAEEIVKKARCKWAILRTVLVYGVAHDYGRTNIVLWVRDSLQAGKVIKVVDDQFRTPTLAEDLAQGCWLAAKHDAEGIYHISGSEMLTPYDMALQVADYFSLDKSLIDKADGSTFTQPAKRPPKTGFIITKAKKDLGYLPHTFAEGIQVVAEQAAQ